MDMLSLNLPLSLIPRRLKDALLVYYIRSRTKDDNQFSSLPDSTKAIVIYDSPRDNVTVISFRIKLLFPESWRFLPWTLYVLNIIQVLILRRINLNK